MHTTNNFSNVLQVEECRRVVAGYRWSFNTYSRQTMILALTNISEDILVETVLWIRVMVASSLATGRGTMIPGLSVSYMARWIGTRSKGGSLSFRLFPARAFTERE